VALLVGCALFVSRADSAQEASPANNRLALAYHRCNFSDLYPPEAVKEIQGKLQNASRPTEVLAQLLKDPRREVRLLVILLLGELGEADGVKALWTILQDDVESVRVAASGAITRASHLSVVPQDLAAIKDQRPEVRRLAIATLGRVGGKDIAPVFISAMDDENELVRLEAIKAIAERPGDAIGKALLKRLQDPSAVVRTSAAHSLSGHPHPDIIKALEDALKDPDWHVRAAAVASLGRRGNSALTHTKLVEAVIGIVRSDDFALVRDRSTDALTFVNTPTTVNALIEALISDDHNSRLHAARAISVGRCTTALPQLMGHCTNSNAEVRERIMQIFGAIGSSNQLAAVNEAINDPEVTVRLAAIEAYQKIGQRTGAATLAQKIDDPDPHVRAAAVRAFGLTRDKSVAPKLRPLLHDPNSFVRSAAAEALGRIGDRAAVPDLIKLLSGSELPGAGKDPFFSDSTKASTNKFMLTVAEQKGVYITALSQLRASEALDLVIQHGLKSDDLGLQATAAYALGRIEDRRAVPPLEGVVKPYYDTLAITRGQEGLVINDGSSAADSRKRDREKEARVRAAVVWALGQIGDSVAQQTLARALNDDNSLVRDNAVEAISKIKERGEREQRPLNETPATAPDKSRSASAARIP
jgi:HEAT repeat protein